MSDQRVEPCLVVLMFPKGKDVRCLAFEPLIEPAIGKFENMLDMCLSTSAHCAVKRGAWDPYLDEELSDRIKHNDGKCGQKGSSKRNHDPGVARNPVPDVMWLDSLFVRQA